MFDLKTVLGLALPAPTYNEALLSSVLNCSLDAIVVIDKESKIVEWNKGATKLFGWPREEVLGQTVTEIIIPKRFISKHRVGMKRYLETGQSDIIGKPVEVIARTKEGMEIPVELSITTTNTYREGRIFVATLRDLREMKERIRKSEELIQELDHRMRNVMMVMQVIIRQSLKHCDPEEVATLLARLFNVTKALDMLRKYGWKKTNLFQLTDSILSSYHTRFDYVGSKNVLVPGRTAISFSLVLYELVTNAIRYGALSKDSNGKVNITWITDNDKLIWSWQEVGGPPLPEESEIQKGYGTELIRRTFTGEGTVDVQFAREGFRCTFVLDFPQLTED